MTLVVLWCNIFTFGVFAFLLNTRLWLSCFMQYGFCGAISIILVCVCNDSSLDEGWRFLDPFDGFLSNISLLWLVTNIDCRVLRLRGLVFNLLCCYLIWWYNGLWLTMLLCLSATTSPDLLYYALSAKTPQNIAIWLFSNVCALITIARGGLAYSGRL